MDFTRHSILPYQTFRLILFSMIATVAGFRFYLHVFGVKHFYIAGHIARHLFWGALITIVAAFVLAFEPQQQLTAIICRVALGIGAGMVLDEIVYLAATNMTDHDYLSSISVLGSVAFLGFGIICLYIAYRLTAGH